MTIHPSRALLAALLALPTAGALAGLQPASAESPPRVEIPIQQRELDNGLKVILVEDPTAPIVTVGLMYDVGSANEQEGRTGFAHLFEHLMFQGSRNVAPGEHLKIVDRYGGQANATTGTDWTYYFQTVPSNQLDLALFLEADRLHSLDISEENLRKEIEVVKEERRLRFDNEAYGNSRMQIEELVYDSFAYSHDGVGSLADLEAASLADVHAFFDRYYRASNLVLLLIGDLQADAAMERVRHYLGDLPRRAKPAQADRTEPPQREARRRVVEDPLAPLPQLRFAYKAVPGDDPDFFALSVLSAVLQDGRSSRLHQALVQQRELATSVRGGMDDRRGPGALGIAVIVRSNEGVEEVEREVAAQIRRLQDEPVAEWELAKARNSIAAQFVASLARGVIRSFHIGAYTLDYGDPQRVNRYLDRIWEVTAQDVQRVARTHLRDDNLSELVTMPGKQKEASP